MCIYCFLNIFIFIQSILLSAWLYKSMIIPSLRKKWFVPPFVMLGKSLLLVHLLAVLYRFFFSSWHVFMWDPLVYLLTFTSTFLSLETLLFGVVYSVEWETILRIFFGVVIMCFMLFHLLIVRMIMYRNFLVCCCTLPCCYSDYA